MINKNFASTKTFFFFFPNKNFISYNGISTTGEFVLTLQMGDGL